VSPAIASLFEVLADPRRREILAFLRDGERTVGEIAEQVPIAQAGVSRHLRVLRDVGLVTVRADAQRRWYGIRPQPLIELDTWLQSYRELWADPWNQRDT
jgi:DNA-binding transcriptional ArsR family regulator